MKIKDLITELLKLDQEMTVVTYDALDTQYRPLGRMQKAYLIREKNQTGGRVSYKKPKVTPSEEVMLFYPGEK